MSASTQNQALAALLFLYVVPKLTAHLERVRRLHASDVAAGFGRGGRGVQSPADGLLGRDNPG